MTDVYNQEGRGMPRERQPWDGPRNNQVAKVEGSTSATGGFRFGISGTTVAGTVTALTVVTPFIVLFSPVLVTVFVVVFLLATGYFTAREFGVGAKTGLARMYNYVTDVNRNRIQKDSLDRETVEFGLRAREMKDRDERPSEGGRYETGGEAEGSLYNLVKAATASTTGTSLVFFSGLTFIGTVIALVLATPPLVIFSPVLVPALITVFLLASGFVSSGGFGVAAATVLAWTYKYATEGRPTETTNKFVSNMRESRGEEAYRFDSKPQESRNEKTRVFGSKSDQGDRLDREESRKPDSKVWETRDRGEHGIREGQYPTRGFHETTQTQGGNYQVAKAATATAIGGSLLVLSSLTFVGTVIGLTVATPLMVIFSPVLVPAMTTVFLLASGLFASGGFSVSAVTTLGWLYKYVTSENPREMNLFDRESGKQGSTPERRDFTDFTRDIDEHVGEEGTQGAKPRERRDFTRDVDAGEEGRRGFRYTTESGKGYNQGVKVATATTAGGSLLVFSGLMFVGTVIALTIATPLLVLFSPVLVPALIALSILATGFVASGGFGVTGTMVLAWLYRYVSSGQQRREGDSFDHTTNMMNLKGRERTYMSDQAIRSSHQATGDIQYTSGAEKGDNQMVKAATAATTGGSMLVFSCLTFAGTVIALTVATPLLVIFSPVLVPALIIMFLLPAGFVTSGGFGIAGLTVLSWIYKFVTSGNQTRADSFDHGTDKMGSKGWEMRDIGEHGIGAGHHVTNSDRVIPASHHKV